jgi:hypothetical protein
MKERRKLDTFFDSPMMLDRVLPLLLNWSIFLEAIEDEEAW